MTVKLEFLQDPFTAAAINTSLWNNITGGAASLDTVNDLVSLAQPTGSGATNTFGTNSTWDATSSEIYAQIGTVPNGNGTTSTALRLILDANNSISMRLRAGIFELARQTAGTTVITALGTYDPNAHRWWRIREAAGTFYAEASADSWNWTTLGSTTYSWNATALQVAFQTSASATEVPSLVATIANINSQEGGPYNLAWPQLEHAFGARWNCNGGDSPLDRYADVSLRARGSRTIGRGRQYELDQIQSGERTGAFDNTDGLWDPNNAAGPFYGHIQPYQPLRDRAQWPRTRNLLTPVQASGGDVGGYPLGTIPQGNGGVSTFSDVDPSGGSIVASGTAWQGGRVFQFAVPSGANLTICYTPQPAAERGVTYTMQMRVRNLTPSTSLQVHGVFVSATAGQVSTITQGSSATLTGSATAAWTTVTVTASVRDDGAYLICGLRLTTAAAAACTIQVDGWQLERGSVATPWTCPGTWFPMYSGFAERYPPSWDDSGTYGVVTPTAVDAFSLLSQTQLTDPLTAEIGLSSPRFLYKLNDPAGSLTAADAAGGNPAAALGNSKYGPGSFVFGTAITATDPVGGIYTGSTDTVATITNANPGTNLIGPATFLNLGSAGINGPADPTRWSRMLAFRYTGPTPTTASYLWSSMDRQRSSVGPIGSHIYIYLDTSGKPVLSVQGPTGASLNVFPGGATNCADGNWHLLLFGYNQATGQAVFSQDGAAIAYYSGLSPDIAPTGLIGDNVGGFVDTTIGNGTTYAFKGDIAFVAEFATFLVTAQLTGIYAAWKAACDGESTDARYARILRYSGYTGPSSIQTGLTTSMGPARTEGQDAVTALQAVVDTENGEHYVARDGTVVFRSRAARYNATSSAYVFGERQDLGEWPYEGITLDYDSTHLANQVTVTQESSGQTFYAPDATSIANYFPRPLTRTINPSSALEAQDAAGYLLSRYRQPSTRVAGLRLHPSAMPALWPVALGLELGTRVRVMRRPPAPAPPITIECFVEKIDWELADDNEAFLTLQCSPADTTPYAVFAAWHTTLANTIAAGVSSITINASQDNTNLLAAQLASGQQLVLGQNTANAETVTVSAVGATSPGWTTATITLTTATAKSHTSGDVVCEPLPAGTTDPTTWDGTRFDASAFAY
ncbi:hypothetical protein ABZ883_40565 [Streptomyces sp. NPDC046977]|uniref:hypothetical protein n=1 Tax=Streptomyces sp. NPDC046977 TaxID=3154703 RepID=UPI00340950CE